MNPNQTAKSDDASILISTSDTQLKIQRKTIEDGEEDIITRIIESKQLTLQTLEKLKSIISMQPYNSLMVDLNDIPLFVNEQLELFLCFISEFINSSTDLRSLAVSEVNNSVHEIKDAYSNHVKALFAFASANKNLEYFRCELLVRLPAEEMVMLFNSRNNLQNINLNTNDIDDDCLGYLADNILENHQLIYLGFSTILNDFTLFKTQDSSLINFLLKFKKLQVLDLRNSCIEFFPANFISKLLQENEELQEIFLEIEDFIALFNGRGEVEQGEYTNEDFDELLKEISAHPNITKITFCHEWLKEGDKERLEDALAGNKKMWAERRFIKTKPVPKIDENQNNQNSFLDDYIPVTLDEGSYLTVSDIESLWDLPQTSYEQDSSSLEKEPKVDLSENEITKSSLSLSNNPQSFFEVDTKIGVKRKNSNNLEEDKPPSKTPRV